MAFQTLLGGLQVASAITGFFSSNEQAKDLEQQAAFQRDQFLINAQISEIIAEDAIRRGSRAANDVRRRNKTLIGRQRSAFAGQNVRVGSGVAQEAEADTAFFGELDAKTTENNAWLEAWGQKANSLSSEFRAQTAFQQGQINASATRTRGAANTILGAAQGFGRIVRSQS